MADAASVAELVARLEQFLRLRQWEAAEAACRDLVSIAPLEPEAWSRLGIVSLLRERFDEAEIAFGQALVLAPGRAADLSNRSIARFRLGRHAEAEADAREAIALDDSIAAHWLNLGACLSGRERWSEAAAAYRQTVARDAGNAVAWCSLGAAELWLGNLSAAERCFQNSFALAPATDQTLTKYAYLLLRRGEIERAVQLLRTILDRDPHSAEAFSALGNAHLLLDQLPEAEAAFRRAVELAPGSRLARRDFARTLIRRSSLAQAERCARQLIAEDPAAVDGWDLLGAVHWGQGQISEAIAACRRCIELEPNPSRHSSLLCDMHYAANVTLHQLFEAHRQWDTAYARHLRPERPAAPRQECRDKPLRLGFVSADFGRHPTGCFVLPALECLDRDGCSVVCYSDRVVEDEYTARFRAASDVWRVTKGLADDELAAQIRGDEIDILFDLMGHTGHRLTMFAHQPASMQVSWFGYVGTTGLAAMDFLLADRHYVREGEEPWYTERILRMPNGYACYGPPPDCPAVARLPALAGGSVTFGCFNNPAKFSPFILEAWATILQRVPASQLLLKYGGLHEPEIQNRIRQVFENHSVTADQIVFEGSSPHAELLACYNRVDLALDTQPFSGCTTTCEALWMGVPVITFPGKTFAGRHSTSHLMNAGYPQFVASDLESYIELAVEWASRLDELAALRSQMREQVGQSPLCDAPKFARDFLAVLRQAWESGVEGGPTAYR
jgi:protein O-GlcNAc transferase